MGILAALIIGAIAGWLAGKIVHGAGFGLIGNMVVGIIGALVASWVRRSCILRLPPARSAPSLTPPSAR